MKIQSNPANFQPINFSIETMEELFYITRLIQSTGLTVDRKFGVQTRDIFDSLDAECSKYAEYRKTPALTSTIDFDSTDPE